MNETSKPNDQKYHSMDKLPKANNGFVGTESEPQYEDFSDIGYEDNRDYMLPDLPCEELEKRDAKVSRNELRNEQLWPVMTKHQQAELDRKSKLKNEYADFEADWIVKNNGKQRPTGKVWVEKEKKSCYICGSKYHLANKCPNREEVRCHHCNKLGHKRPDCPQLKQTLYVQAGETGVPQEPVKNQGNVPQTPVKNNVARSSDALPRNGNKSPVGPAVPVKPPNRPPSEGPKGPSGPPVEPPKNDDKPAVVVNIPKKRIADFEQLDKYHKVRFTEKIEFDLNLLKLFIKAFFVIVGMVFVASFCADVWNHHVATNFPISNFTAVEMGVDQFIKTVFVGPTLYLGMSLLIFLYSMAMLSLKFSVLTKEQRYVFRSMAQVEKEDSRTDEACRGDMKHAEPFEAIYEHCTVVKLWCIPIYFSSKTKLKVNLELLVQITTHANMLLDSTDEVACSRLENASKTNTSVNLNRYDVLMKDHVRQNTVLLAVGIFKEYRFMVRNVPFYRTPQPLK